MRKPRTNLAKNFPHWAELKPDNHISIQSIQSALSTDEAAIGIIPAFSNVFVVVVTKEGAGIIKLDSNRHTLEALVKQVRSSVQSDVFDMDAARELHASLLPNSAQSLLAGKDHYRMVSSGVFTTLPFSLLITNEDKNAPKWLVERAATSVEPSLNIKKHTQKYRNTSGKFLGIGAPKPFPKKKNAAPNTPIKIAQNFGNVSTYFRGSGLNYTALADLPELPGAASEIKDMGEILAPKNAKLLIGKKANETALNQLNLADYFRHCICYPRFGSGGDGRGGGTGPDLNAAQKLVFKI